MSVTYTDDGAIPHLLVATPGGDILAPVKLERREFGQGYRLEFGSNSSHDRLPKPLKRDGRLVFALPGGFEVEG